MTMTNSMTVNASADAIWQMIGPDFAAVDKWMAATPTAEPISGTPIPGAPVKGRNSFLIKKFQPMYQEEIITEYSDAKRTVSFQVTMRKTPKLMPLKGYDSTVIIEPISDGSSKVTWIGNAQIHWFGKVLSGPLLKSLDDGFIRNLEEIKHIMETGQPHPRKVAKNKAEGIAA